MELRALVTLALSVVLTACSDDGGGGSTGNLTSETDPNTTTGGLTTGTTTGSEPTTGAPTSEPGSGTTTGEPGTTTGDDTTSTTGAPLCDGGGLGPGDHTITLEHGGLMRSAIVHVPTDYDPQAPTPVVLNFHGFTQNAAGQQQLSGMNPVAEEHDFIVVYPEGVENRGTPASAAARRSSRTSTTSASSALWSRACTKTCASTPSASTPPACRTAATSRIDSPARPPT
ncbi:alpha/beta hydrolase family esterase [Nannocystis pusilla]|uniref:alpha/beta hydrolase family esterase n=1 Tax=Nannocystis pusilla TaxID=889268 RepID=UPI003B81860F